MWGTRSRIGYGFVGSGFNIKCPICEQCLSRNWMGVRAHLNKHARNKELTNDAALEIHKNMFGTWGSK